MNNDTMTLFLATSILAIGGLGMYMFNSNDKPNKGGRRNKKIVPNDDYESDEEEPEEEPEPEPEPDPEPEPEEDENEEYVSRSRGAKTKKSRKQNKGTKRRY
jgi:hypothetical protein